MWQETAAPPYFNPAYDRWGSKSVRLRSSTSFPVYPQPRTFASAVGTSVQVESRMGAVAWAIRQRSGSHPRSSNRTCPIKASGSPPGFTVRHAERPLGQAFETQQTALSIDNVTG